MQQRLQSVGTGAGRRGEQGYILLMMVVIIALLLIAMAIAAPKMKKAIQRDQEVELKHRGMEYARAVKLYYRKFNTYPVSIDQLMNTNNQRFLRKKYPDPITGKAQWRLVYYGQTGTGGNTNPNCSTSASAFGGSPGSSASQLGGSPAFGGAAVVRRTAILLRRRRILRAVGRAAAMRIMAGTPGTARPLTVHRRARLAAAVAARLDRRALDRRVAAALGRRGAAALDRRGAAALDPPARLGRCRGAAGRLLAWRA